MRDHEKIIRAIRRILAEEATMSRNVKWVIRIAAGIVLAAAFVWFYPPLRERRLAARYQRFRTEFEAQHAAIDAEFHQHDVAVNGIHWHYVDEGAPDGQVILFLHGFPEGWYSWSKVLRQVDHHYRLIAIDLKGYGRSTTQDDDYNWHTVAAQTLDLMTAMGIKNFYVVSHDWGSIIGSVLVGDHPDRILGYVRMEADLVKPDESNFSNYRHRLQFLLFKNYWLASYLMQDADTVIYFSYRHRLKAPFERADHDYLVYEFSRPGVADRVPRYFLQENWDLDAGITKICENTFPFPVLQLQADSDPAQEMSSFADAAKTCPHVRIEWIRSSSHFSNFDQPGQVAEYVNEFVHGI